MNCQRADDLLQQYLDGGAIESPEWLAHLRQCTECRTRALAGRRLQEGLHRMPALLPPSDLVERIVERVRLERRRARNRTRRRWAAGLALAASVIVALTTWLEWRGWPNQAARQLTLPVRPATTAHRQPVSPSAPTAPTLRESAAELGEVFASLSNQTADETVGQTRRWVSNVPISLWDGFPIRPSIERPIHPLREAGEGVSEGLEPVTTSARRAVDLLLRELPMKAETDQPQSHREHREE